MMRLNVILSCSMVVISNIPLRAQASSVYYSNSYNSYDSKYTITYSGKALVYDSLGRSSLIPVD